MQDDVPPNSWKAILTRVAEMELWSEPRDIRPKWRDYLDRANDLLLNERKPLPKDVVLKVMEGDLGSIPDSELPNTRSKIVIFISSTFTDTKAERNSLIQGK